MTASSLPPDPPSEDSKQVRAARRALDIIELVAEARLLKHSDIAARLGIPKSTTTLILDTLVRSGYLRRDAFSRAYSLGSRILGIAGRYLSEADIVQISQPVLSRLVLDIDESSFLVQAEGDEVLVMWREVCRRRLTYMFSLGERASITDTAGGLAMLAMRGMAQWAPTLARCGVPAGAEADALIAHLREVADGAVAFRAPGRVPEVASLALPIVNSMGVPLAAVSVAVPAHRLDAPLRERVEAALRIAQADIAGQARALGPQQPSL
ncbi:IclR family transcriptional regulator [Pseudacidovorax intermedius]|uniref:IclR family transcriptional regulator n=1 Tax=Pseudacidovorax intermedius TaxID=433924 RepID=UPI0026EE0EF4|nr:IclR family transcriptional regulator [Pseudacidovorax intermedius]